MPDPNLTPPSLTPQQVARFWSYVDRSPGQGPNGDCHEWTKGRCKKGYGLVGTTHRTFSAHRLAFYFKHGRWPIANGCHSCDNPPCCNADHIWEGDQSANMADCKSKGRSRPGPLRWNFKSTPETVSAIHALRAQGLSCAKVGARLGVSKAFVSAAGRKSRAENGFIASVD